MTVTELTRNQKLVFTALERAGIDRSQVYLTNAVKHFKYVQRGKRRLHQSPTAKEIDICRWWLEGERDIVKPRLMLALGASAARGLLGKTVSISKARGMPHTLADGGELWVTAHPSYLLRLQDEAKEEQKRLFDEAPAVFKVIWYVSRGRYAKLERAAFGEPQLTPLPA